MSSPEVARREVPKVAPDIGRIVDRAISILAIEEDVFPRYTEDMERSHLALTILIVTSKIAGIVLALAGCILGIVALTGSIARVGALRSLAGGAFSMVGAGVGLLLIIASLLAGLGLVAAGEWIELHIAIEQHTRPTAPPDSGDNELRWVA